MMTPELCRTMAQYNRWQNERLYAACSALGDTARRRHRGAFFGSIHETLDHILWADEIWLSRFGGCPAPEGGIRESTRRHPAWSDLSRQRDCVDDWITAWADGLNVSALERDMSWYSGAAGRDVCRPCGLLVMHMFNHQTHHRGQVHAMLTAAGGEGTVSDLFLMPGLD